MSTHPTPDQISMERVVPRVPRRRGTSGRRYFPPITRLPRVEQWPAPHRAAWAKACFQAGPLDPPGRLAHLQPSSRAEVRKAWARYVSFLTVSEQLDPSEAPALCLTRERFGRFVASLKERVSPLTLRLNIRSLYCAINAMAPDQDWQCVRHHPSLPREAEVTAGRKRIVPP